MVVLRCLEFSRWRKPWWLGTQLQEACQKIWNVCFIDGFSISSTGWNE